MSANIPSSMPLSDLLKSTGYNCPEALQGKTFDEATSGGGGGGGDYPTLYLWKCEANGIISYLYADFATAPDTRPEGSYYNAGNDGEILDYEPYKASWENTGDVYKKVSDTSFTLILEGSEGDIPFYTRIDSDEDAPALGESAVEPSLEYPDWLGMEETMSSVVPDGVKCVFSYSGNSYIIQGDGTSTLAELINALHLDPGGPVFTGLIASYGDSVVIAINIEK